MLQHVVTLLPSVYPLHTGAKSLFTILYPQPKGLEKREKFIKKGQLSYCAMVDIFSPKRNNTGRVILSVSKKNNKVTEIIDNLKVILERKPELGVKSVSDLLCNWIIEKYDKLVEDVADHPQPSGEISLKADKEGALKQIKQDSFLKRLLCKKSIPALDKYNVHKINGKSVSEAYKAGYLTKDEISNIYSGAAQIYYDMTRDTKLSNVLHLINSKNHTKSKNRLEWFNRKMKGVFSLDSTEKIELPKDLHELELVE